MTSLIEIYGIAPPPGVAAEMTLPLTSFDMPWLHFHPIRRLIFYELSSDDDDFLKTLVPKLKESLSLTLKHYLPLAGKLLFPLDTENKPVLRYVAGDSVPLTVSESSADFDNLIGNHVRDADLFYDFVPEIPPLEEEAEYRTVSVFAVKLTLFPGRGVCLGLANHHCIGDASSVVGFIKTWASISKLGGDEEFLTKQNESLPIFDRTIIQDPSGLGSIYWDFLKKVPPKSSSFPLPTGRVRATFVLKQSDINKLKKKVLTKKPELVQVSSFVVATTYIWTCFVKSGEEFDDEDTFAFAVDCRSRINPPIPTNYFGNCLSYGYARIPQPELRGSDGFVIAAVAVAEDIKNRVNDKDKVLQGFDNLPELMKKFVGVRSIGVSGSPKFDLYGVDFGWGKARKVEIVSIDGEQYSMSLCRSRDSDGGLEVGLSLSKERMESFIAIFDEDLSNSDE